MNHWNAAVTSLRNTSRKGTFSDEDFEEYRKAWSQPGAMTSMLNWYRALLQRPSKIPTDVRIHVPVLILWGVKDAFLGKELAPASAAFCERARVVHFEQATHWILREEPDLVNQRILDFINE